MPIARWAAARAAAASTRASTPAKVGLALGIGVGALLYAAFGPLWFDLSWWALGRVFGPRLTVRRRAVSAAAVAIVVTALIVATAPPPGENRGAPNLAAATGPIAGGSASGTATDGSLAAPTAESASAESASSGPATAPPPTAPDDDDEPGVVPPEASAPPTVEPGSSLPQIARLPGEPDPKLTPGALNPAVTQATIGSTICVSGWTATVRPSSSYTTRLKIQQIALYGYTDTRTSSYEEDHLIPLELGGAPSDAKNLWPQPWDSWLTDGRAAGARTKDAYENSLKKAVCAGTMTLAAAQSLIGIHWVHSFYRIALPNGPGSTGPAVPGSTTPGSTARAPRPTASAGSTSASTGCDPAYPTVCIPPSPPDLDCADVPYKYFTVLPPDPHHFDGDIDGIGCES